jgi:hypothetical protein
MSFSPRYAVLIDGAFLVHKLQQKLRAFPTADHVEDVAGAIGNHDCVRGLDRLRVYFSVQAIVVCTGDSDLIPAFKLARREGLRVFLCHFGHSVKRELNVHADRVIHFALPTIPAGAPQFGLAQAVAAHFP